MPANRSSMFWTCSPIRQARACTSGTPSGTSPPTSTPATNGRRGSTCCTRWATTLSAFPPSSTPSRRASTPPSPPARTSPATASSSTRSASPSTGTARCAPPIQNITNGPSGCSSSCSTIITTRNLTKPAPSASWWRSLPPTARPESAPPKQNRWNSPPPSGTR